VTETVVLAVGLAAYTGETMTLDHTLETFTFGSTDDIHEFHTFDDDVGEGDGVA
jgi:hypothetical protein